MSTTFYDDDDRKDFDRHSLSSSFIDMAHSPPTNHDGDTVSEYSFYTRQRSSIQSFDSSTPILSNNSSKPSAAKSGSNSNIRINTNRLVRFFFFRDLCFTLVSFSLALPLIMSQPSYGSNGPKPPVPTSPKPAFYRTTSNDPSRAKPSSSSSQAQDAHPELKLVHVPPTTNNLNPAERADLIRKSRKLARVFGQIPDAMSVSPRQHDPPTRNFLSSYPSPNSKHHRPAASFSVESDAASSLRRPSKQDSRPSLRSSISSGSGRRHSAPLSPFDVASLSNLLTDPEYEINSSRGHTSAHNTLWEGGDYPGAKRKKKASSLTQSRDARL